MKRYLVEICIFVPIFQNCWLQKVITINKIPRA